MQRPWGRQDFGGIFCIERKLLQLRLLNWRWLWDLVQCLVHWQNSVAVSSCCFLSGRWEIGRARATRFQGKPLGEHSRYHLKALALGAVNSIWSPLASDSRCGSCRGPFCWGILAGLWVPSFWGILFCWIHCACFLFPPTSPGIGRR